MKRKRSSGASTSRDPDDAPPLTERWFKEADLYQGERLVRRGRPKSERPKLAVKLRLSPDVVEHFRAGGAGWQTRINETLVKAVRRERRRAESHR